MKLISKLKNSMIDALSTKASFEKLAERECIYLYAGDVPQNRNYKKFTGLSLSRSNHQHIRHDITNSLPLRDCCVDICQSEDVFEHINPQQLPDIINEIYRVLKPAGIFRLSLPDYRCDLLLERTLKDERGELIYDPGGGGHYVDGKVVNGGHLWFPRYELVKAIIGTTFFTNVSFYHYYDESGRPVTKTIDYSIGHVMRTPDHDKRVQNPYRPMSIVLDCRK